MIVKNDKIIQICPMISEGAVPCCGSNCMAWRWADHGRRYHQEKLHNTNMKTMTFHDSRPPEELPDGVWERELTNRVGYYKLYQLLDESERVGYCGMAGRPTKSGKK